MDEQMFYAWFAGLCDGEACFGVLKQHNGAPPPYFMIRLRADDLAVLEFANQTIRAGSISVVSGGSDLSANPVAQWRAYGKQCAKIVRALDNYPLKSKKKNDYDLWVEAVREYVKPYPDWDKLWAIKTAIEKARVYDAVNIETTYRPIAEQADFLDLL